MVAVLETWTLVVGRGLDWAEVPVSGGDVNLGEEGAFPAVQSCPVGAVGQDCHHGYRLVSGTAVDHINVC